MYNAPKTPSRHRSRSDAKTPLTPSLISGLNSVSLASSPPKRRGPTKSKSSTFDTSNPFISSVPPSSRSRPASPIKRVVAGGIPVSEDLQRQAGGGVIRKGGVESRLDVVTLDYVAPPPKPEAKRSRSTPAAVRTAISRCILTCKPKYILYRTAIVEIVSSPLANETANSM